MKAEELRITVYTARSMDELPADSRTLVERAQTASKSAWSPYSGFNVGAALLLANGEILTGSNQENSAFPSGLCAERVVLFYAGANYPDVPVVKIAVAAGQSGVFTEHPVYPCGGCRQALLESELRFDQPVEIIMYGVKEIRMVRSVKDLLPLPFEFSK